MLSQRKKREEGKGKGSTILRHKKQAAFTYRNLVRKNSSRELDEYLQHVVSGQRDWRREKQTLKEAGSQISVLPDTCSHSSLLEDFPWPFPFGQLPPSLRTHLRFYFLWEGFPAYFPPQLGDPLTCFHSTLPHALTVPFTTLHHSCLSISVSPPRRPQTRLAHHHIEQCCV